ncbi:MAG: hypothetical protein A3H45_11560 [Ignavibacteria bacterium RIFCSPLOWO2_02_FULL_55_14]|nr:MAG: hypothetical protein A2X68_05445 [Ignavibacteria bacterium GWC2_56_12]OGU62451.1 MAG: hypothetical protein A3C56_05720 [Ignavibacteria bacterium RIFCSPHIGHO2_02_FULL_56_12]OGU73887.1 MAG: hypothetical protein A3G43_00880 [Ignavibacteria bacterium RIFCSPLOWO2_12_FULL_56_21]OGU75605.1 MAG: hypothetical protein A3H45_11560 [Ignavibacteria bacterium RIFCSPLOWO2_02_FULL_55_14]HAV24038.1 hypothetical protein [Bacteroidota bacterium]
MKHAITYQGPLLFWCLVIYVVSSVHNVPTIPIALHPDKIAHMVVFGILGVTANRAFSHQSSFPSLALHASIAAVLFAGLYGVVDELHQRAVPGRSFDIWDMVADVLGAALFVWLLNKLRDRRAAAH